MTPFEEYTPEMARAAVAKGAAWLEENYPGCLRTIDKEKLDLSRPEACILGQAANCITHGKAKSNTTRGYNDALDYIMSGLDEDTYTDHEYLWAEEHGFYAYAHTWIETQVRYEMLNIAWKEVLLKAANE
jgi:hypothetical protein